jgi:hypothetical protein
VATRAARTNIEGGDCCCAAAVAATFTVVLANLNRGERRVAAVQRGMKIALGMNATPPALLRSRNSLRLRSRESQAD